MKKRDLNYIAAVEKAVKEKYGSLGIKNFRADWSPEHEQQYLDQLKNWPFNVTAKFFGTQDLFSSNVKDIFW